MQLIPLNIATALLQSVLFGLLYEIFPQKRFSSWITTIFVSLAMIAYTIFLDFINVINENPLRTILTLIFTFILICVVCRNRLRNLVLYWMIVIGIIVLSDAIALAISDCAMHVKQSQFWMYTAERSIGMNFFSILFYYFIAIASSFFKNIKRPMRLRIHLLLTLSTFTQSVLLFGIYFFCVDAMQEYLAVFSVFSSILIITMTLILNNILQNFYANAKQENELEQLKMQRNLDHKYYQLVQSNAEELSAFRHEIRNQLQVAHVLSERDPGKADEILEHLESKLDTYHPMLYCRNPIVNTILVLKSNEAAANKISYSISVDLEGWHLSDMDLSSLFSNLLDNALEGCIASGDEETYIKLKASSHSNFLILRVENSCRKELLDNHGHYPATSKINLDKRHGYGQKILTSIVSRYDGTLQVSCKDGVFIVRILIPLSPGNPESVREIR